MKIISLIAAGAVALLSLASIAHAIQGDPIPSRDIVLEGDPNSIVAATGKTDAKGNAGFPRLNAGRYTVSVPDLSQFKEPVVFAVGVNGAAPLLSEPLKPGKGKGYALDKAGRKLVFTVEKPGTPFVVTLSTAK